MKCPHSFVIANKDHYEQMDYAGSLSIVSGTTVPCGTCAVCRRNRAAEWSVRLQHELHYHKDASFITLTYNNEHLPVNEWNLQTLYKPDFQDFMKRFRKDLGRKIKMFACGEYGEQTGRPHYHAIIFGYKPGIKDIVQHGYGSNLTYSDKRLQRLWSKEGVPIGNVTIGSVTPDSIHYVTGYILKANLKKTALMARQKEFTLTSQGLGKQYCLEFADDLADLRNPEGKITPIPRIYIKWLEKEGIKINKENVASQAAQKQLAIMKKISKKPEFKDFSLETRSRVLHHVKKARKQNEMVVEQLLKRGNEKKLERAAGVLSRPLEGAT
jgi:hypothetical protein